MHIRIVIPVNAIHAIEDRDRPLRRGGIVEIYPRLAARKLRIEDWKVLTALRDGNLRKLGPITANDFRWGCGLLNRRTARRICSGRIQRTSFVYFRSNSQGRR